MEHKFREQGRTRQQYQTKEQGDSGQGKLVAPPVTGQIETATFTTDLAHQKNKDGGLATVHGKTTSSSSVGIYGSYKCNSEVLNPDEGVYIHQNLNSSSTSDKVSGGSYTIISGKSSRKSCFIFSLSSGYGTSPFRITRNGNDRGGSGELLMSS